MSRFRKLTLDEAAQEFEVLDRATCRSLKGGGGTGLMWQDPNDPLNAGLYSMNQFNQMMGDNYGIMPMSSPEYEGGEYFYNGGYLDEVVVYGTGPYCGEHNIYFYKKDYPDCPKCLEEDGYFGYTDYPPSPDSGNLGGESGSGSSGGTTGGSGSAGGSGGSSSGGDGGSSGGGSSGPSGGGTTSPPGGDIDWGIETPPEKFYTLAEFEFLKDKGAWGGGYVEEFGHLSKDSVIVDKVGMSPSDKLDLGLDMLAISQQTKVALINSLAGTNLGKDVNIYIKCSKALGNIGTIVGAITTISDWKNTSTGDKLNTAVGVALIGLKWNWVGLALTILDTVGVTKWVCNEIGDYIDNKK